MKYKLPAAVLRVISQLEQAGFEGFAVGGAVRDLLLKRQPRDWDVATDAKPEDIQKVFPDSLYENKFGTVTVKMRKLENIDEIQVTTYRIEEKYTDKRHPDEVKFTGSLREDLARRDFTINALAMDKSGEIYDPFAGQNDLESGLIRTVGAAELRFGEDALRLLRAIRFAVELDFMIEKKTVAALKNHSHLLAAVSFERIRDEFVLIINSRAAAQGVRDLAVFNLLDIFIPELTLGIGVAQSKHHIYEVFEHLVRSLDYAAKKNYSLAVRLAALFHDAGKPQTKRGRGEAATFYNHEIVSAKLTSKIMRRLKFQTELSQQVELLVRYHQFYYTPEEVTATSVRRLVKNVGLENIDKLIQVREADRIGSGVPKAVPYKLRHLKFMVEKVSTDPVSVKMLAVNGHDLMTQLKLQPNRKLGLMLNSLLAAVLAEPKLNVKKNLLALAKELNSKSETALARDLQKTEAAQKAQEDEIKRKYYVK